MGGEEWGEGGGNLFGNLAESLRYALFLRNCLREEISESDRRAAPRLLLGLIGIHGHVVARWWIGYLMR